MNSFMSRISLIKQAITGLSSADISNETKDILLDLTKVVAELADKVEKLEESHLEINEYVTVLDENLGNIEDELYGFEEDDEEFSSFDYVDVCCDKCNETLAVEKTLVNSENEILCPNCHNSISL